MAFLRTFCQIEAPNSFSRVWRNFFKLLGVTISLSSGYHPQTNVQAERKIQEIGSFLRTFCHSHKDSWNQFIGWAEYAKNSLINLPLDLLPSSAYSATNHRCSPGLKSRQKYQRSTTGSERARGSGTMLTISSNMQCAGSK